MLEWLRCFCAARECLVKHGSLMCQLWQHFRCSTPSLYKHLLTVVLITSNWRCRRRRPVARRVDGVIHRGVAGAQDVPGAAPVRGCS